MQVFAVLQTILCGRRFVDEGLWARFRGQRFATTKIWRYDDLRIQKLQICKKKCETINADV